MKSSQKYPALFAQKARSCKCMDELLWHGFCSPTLQAAELFQEHFSQCPAAEIHHTMKRWPLDTEDSDSEDSGLDSILYTGD